MPFDFLPQDARELAGRTAYEDGLAAEVIALRDYLARGYRLVAQRWRGRCGEIDLIFEGNGAVDPGGVGAIGVPLVSMLDRYRAPLG